MKKRLYIHLKGNYVHLYTYELTNQQETPVQLVPKIDIGAKYFNWDDITEVLKTTVATLCGYRDTYQFMYDFGNGMIRDIWDVNKLNQFIRQFDVEIWVKGTDGKTIDEAIVSKWREIHHDYTSSFFEIFTLGGYMNA